MCCANSFHSHHSGLWWGQAAGDGDKVAVVQGIMGNVCEGQRVLGIKVTHNRHGQVTSRGIERERGREREGGSRQTAHRRKCDTGCPIMTPLPNTTDKTHGEWKRECRRQGKGDRVGWWWWWGTRSRGKRVWCDSPAVPTAATERPAAAERCCLAWRETERRSKTGGKKLWEHPREEGFILNFLSSFARSIQTEAAFHKLAKWAFQKLSQVLINL